MKPKHLYASLFVLVALAQLYAPASLILGKENILRQGTAYRFKTAPIDPNDPFRGKYITLSFDANEFTSLDTSWQYGEELFVLLDNDSAGFARIRELSRNVPQSGDYVRATVNNTWKQEGGMEVQLNYPFYIFYMEESKALEAEIAYREAQFDSNQVAWALVRVKEGESALEDVLIDGVSVRDLREQGLINQP